MLLFQLRLFFLLTNSCSINTQIHFKDNVEEIYRFSSLFVPILEFKATHLWEITFYADEKICQHNGNDDVYEAHTHTHTKTQIPANVITEPRKKKPIDEITRTERKFR